MVKQSPGTVTWIEARALFSLLRWLLTFDQRRHLLTNPFTIPSPVQRTGWDTVLPLRCPAFQSLLALSQRAGENASVIMKTAIP